MLITRPQPGADETAARVAALGLAPVVGPVLRIDVRPSRHLQTIGSGAVDAILVTSRHALAAVPAGLRAVPLFAVGDATAEQARRLEFADVRSAGGDARTLAALVMRTAPGGKRKRLLHVTGRAVGHDLAEAIRAAGGRLTRRVVYAQVAERDLPEAACHALSAGCLGAALFFSAETARAFVGLVGRARLAGEVRRVTACAIGQTTAVALESLPWGGIRVAARPNQDGILALLQ